MRFEIQHVTHYDYASPARDSFNETRLKPVSNEHQTLESHLLKVLPASRLKHYSDFYANWVQHFEIAEPHQSLTIESLATVSTCAPNVSEGSIPAIPLIELPQRTHFEQCYDFLQPSSMVDNDPGTWRLAMDAVNGISDSWRAARSIMQFIFENFAYEPASTQVNTHMREVIGQRRGVCQDFAHVAIGLCRATRIPALYVSGYLATETASATHAWMEVHIPGAGWIGLDPTHNRLTDETYIKLAVGRDYSDVPPVKGHYRGARDRTMKVSVKIRALEN